eukprot:10569584-Alexandrium_andersonii.AAC.1
MEQAGWKRGSRRPEEGRPRPLRLHPPPCRWPTPRALPSAANKAGGAPRPRRRLRTWPRGPRSDREDPSRRPVEGHAAGGGGSPERDARRWPGT